MVQWFNLSACLPVCLLRDCVLIRWLVSLAALLCPALPCPVLLCPVLSTLCFILLRADSETSRCSSFCQVTCDRLARVAADDSVKKDLDQEVEERRQDVVRETPFLRCTFNAKMYLFTKTGLGQT